MNEKVLQWVAKIMHYGHYDRDGNPVSEQRGYELWEEDRTVSLDIFPGEKVEHIRVSTVFIPLNLGFGDTPLIYETLIFDDPKNAVESYCERYATVEEARKGHEEALATVKPRTWLFVNPS